jgi:hypothetical protein
VPFCRKIRLVLKQCGIVALTEKQRRTPFHPARLGAYIGFWRAHECRQILRQGEPSSRGPVIVYRFAACQGQDVRNVARVPIA